MSKITVYAIKTGESLDIPDVHYEILDTLLTADGLVVAIESGCSACGGGTCCLAEGTVGCGEQTATDAVASEAAAPAAEAPAASC